MKINEIRVYEEVPAQFVATHYGGPFGLSRIMLHSDGKLYHKTQQGIQPWQGNPNNKISPAYIKGTLVNGNKVPYPQGTTFATAPKAAAPAASAAAPAASAAANTATPTNVTLRKGSKGEAVKKLQYDLGVQPADGVFGPSTEAAVKDFQQRMMPGETADGIVGPKTNTAIQQSAAIDTGDNPEIEKSDPNSQFAALSGFATNRKGGIANNPSQVDAIKELQAELERRGYYKGAIDGKYGPGTREAVKAFQSKFDLFVDGDAGPKTIQALMQRDGSITQTTLDDPQDQDASGQDGRNTAAGAIGPVGANAVDAEKTTDGGRVQQGPYQEGDEITDELQGQMEQAGITDLGMVGETITQEDAIALNRAWQNGEIDGPESAADGPAGGAKAPTETPPAASTLEVLEPQPRGYGMDQGKVIIKRGDTYFEVNVSRERAMIGQDGMGYVGSSLRNYEYDPSNPQAPVAKNADAKWFPVSAFDDVTTLSVVPARPPATANRRGARLRIEWDRQYGNTHNPDGTPKNESVEPMPKGVFMVEDRAIWRSLYGKTHYTNGQARPRTFISESKSAIPEITFEDDDKFFENYGVMWFNEDEDLDEAEYQGRKVKLGKPMAGDVKKFKVYVKNPNGNVVKVNFGQKGARIKKDNPERRRSFRARHNCDNPGPRHKARYWSCRKW